MRSRAAHFWNSGCSGLSTSRPLSRNASRKILAWLQRRPDRFGKAAGRRREHLVDLVLLIGVEPHPSLHAVEQADLLGAGVVVLGGAVDRNDAIRRRAALSSDRACDP